MSVTDEDISASFSVLPQSPDYIFIYKHSIELFSSRILPSRQHEEGGSIELLQISSVVEIEDLCRGAVFSGSYKEVHAAE